MPGPHPISGRELVRKLERVGFRVVRQKGSHMILRRDVEPALTVCVPDHRELKRETPQNILRHIHLTRSDLDRLG
jgi:predicted RNA binding protein YcfA (HicA-like mRNA interferase family)